MQTSTDLLVKMLEEEKKNGSLNWNGSVPMIPELFLEAPIVAECLYNNLQPYMNNGISLISTTLGWCAYAGLGAAAMWNEDWPTLKSNGIVPALTTPRGIGEMDEFVLDYIGLGFNSKEGKELTERIHLHSDITMLPVLGPVAGGHEQKAFMQQFNECCIAMFEYGVTVQMYRMGMK